MYTRTFVLFLLFVLYTFIIIFAIMSEKGRDRYMQGRLSCLHEQSVLHISDERSDRGKPEVFRGALPVSVTSCYLVLKKVFCDFCLSGFVMESYKAIILTFSLRMNFLRVADIERIKSHKGAPSGYTIMP